jgi:hypothetical protein
MVTRMGAVKHTAPVSLMITALAKAIIITTTQKSPFPIRKRQQRLLNMARHTPTLTANSTCIHPQEATNEDVPKIYSDDCRLDGNHVRPDVSQYV